MLPKQNRLSKKSEFQSVLTEKNVIQSPLFGLVYKKTVNKSLSPRFGFIVSNKISKKAVERNRIRRILRIVIRELLPKIDSGYEFVVLVKKAILDAPVGIIKDELGKALQKVGVIK